MDRIIQSRMQLLRSAARSDICYQKSSGKFVEAEREFLEILPELTDAQQDCLWHFINLSNEVDNALLEFACQYLAL